MSNLYFEFSEHVLSMGLFPHKYMATFHDKNTPGVRTWNECMKNSERVWREQDGKVWFIKNRRHWPNPEVDMKEFMWIKLQAEFIKEK